MFGDRLHLRIPADKVDAVMARLQTAGNSSSSITRLHPVPPQLEDVFIALSENGS
jgi:hypothetical protein